MHRESSQSSPRLRAAEPIPQTRAWFRCAAAPTPDASPSPRPPLTPHQQVPPPTAQSKSPERVLLGGIDEAGLGPMLGPLTIGYSVFRAPANATNLWKALDAAVSDDPKRDAERVIVADSKRVFTRNARGERRLEATVLAFLAQLSPKAEIPTDARALLFGGSVAPPSERVGEHPWYAELAPLPHCNDRGRLELVAAKLGRAMAAAEIELVDAGVRVVPAGELNATMRRTGNKGSALWICNRQVQRHLWERWSDEGLQLTVDRLGGRVHYGSMLARGFPGASVRMLSEQSKQSIYELSARRGAGRMGVCFAERAESSSLATALASCLAKFARELSMQAFNKFFGALQENLKPTAGYTTDGRRWVKEAQVALKQVQLPPGVLVRER